MNSSWNGLHACLKKNTVSFTSRILFTYVYDKQYFIHFFQSISRKHVHLDQDLRSLLREMSLQKKVNFTRNIFLNQIFSVTNRVYDNCVRRLKRSLTLEFSLIMRKYSLLSHSIFPIVNFRRLDPTINEKFSRNNYLLAREMLECYRWMIVLPRCTEKTHPRKSRLQLPSRR